MDPFAKTFTLLAGDGLIDDQLQFFRSRVCPLKLRRKMQGVGVSVVLCETLLNYNFCDLRCKDKYI